MIRHLRDRGEVHHVLMVAVDIDYVDRPGPTSPTTRMLREIHPRPLRDTFRAEHRDMPSVRFHLVALRSAAVCLGDAVDGVSFFARTHFLFFDDASTRLPERLASGEGPV